MKKIMVIGSGGAGKSTLARSLGQMLELPVKHLDAIHWNPGWEPTEKKKWQEIQRKLVKEDAWVMDGNYGGTMDIRLAEADTVIFLDYSRALCVFRAFKRRWMYRGGRSRPDMNPDCPEKIDFAFAKWIWDFPKKKRPELLEKLGSLEETKNIVILRSPADTKAFLKSLTNDHSYV